MYVWIHCRKVCTETAGDEELICKENSVSELNV